MTRALALAQKSYDEGGSPIGAVLADSGSGAVLGQGHNGLVQEGNPIVYGEMAAIRAAGRMGTGLEKFDRPLRVGSGRR